MDDDHIEIDIVGMLRDDAEQSSLLLRTSLALGEDGPITKDGLPDAVAAVVAERDGLQEERDIAGTLLARIVVALEPDRDQWDQVHIDALPDTVETLVTERNWLRSQNNRRAGILLHLISLFEDAPVRREDDLPGAVAEILKERHRLAVSMEDVANHVYEIFTDLAEAIARGMHDVGPQALAALHAVYGEIHDELDRLEPEDDGFDGTDVMGGTDD